MEEIKINSIAEKGLLTLCLMLLHTALFSMNNIQSEGTKLSSNGMYKSGGYEFYWTEKQPEIKIKCTPTGEFQTFYNYSKRIDENANAGILLEEAGDSLILHIEDLNSTLINKEKEPGIRLSFSLTDIQLICNSGFPFTSFYNDVKIEQFPSTEIRIINNPVNGDQLEISFANPDGISLIQSMEIIDVNGALVHKASMSTPDALANQMAIPLTGLKNGVYFLRVQSKLETVSYKFSIKK